MKITYYKYYFTKIAQPNGFRTLYDLTPILRTFAEYDNSTLKNSFETENGERTYILKANNRVFLFLITRDQDIIKAINSSSISCEDIHQKLDRGESVGFASYLYLQDSFYAMGTTLKGPKNNSLIHFTNDLIKKLNLTGHTFNSEPFLISTTKAEAARIPFIGRTKVEVDPQNTLGQQMGSFLGFGNSNEIDSYEVTIKPKRGRNLKDANPSFLNRVDETGLKKFIIKAKVDLEEALTEFYISTQGAMQDVINSNAEGDIISELSTRVAANPLLGDKLTELNNNRLYNRDEIQSLDPFAELGSWSSHFSDS